MDTSTSSGLNAATRLSPPLSTKMSSSPGRLSSRLAMASRFIEASSLIAECGQPPVAAECNLISVDGEILLHLDNQFSICQLYSISCHWTVQVGSGILKLVVVLLLTQRAQRWRKIMDGKCVSSASPCDLL